MGSDHVRAKMFTLTFILVLLNPCVLSDSFLDMQLIGQDTALVSEALTCGLKLAVLSDVQVYSSEST
ncbi:hypothetical protein LSH36_471g03027 [Paralvinella palmiformis]|uniref:Uncharacterized protein n=1 Tax=Paralvinella palmiformis TaxID=53620 RepID=A0AAD9MZ36_9ANNE|nr:hypothetical protein LSH36_471g03027 [Paralvinella palmiformis]